MDTYIHHYHHLLQCTGRSLASGLLRTQLQCIFRNHHPTFNQSRIKKRIYYYCYSIFRRHHTPVLGAHILQDQHPISHHPHIGAWYHRKHTLGSLGPIFHHLYTQSPNKRHSFGKIHLHTLILLVWAWACLIQSRRHIHTISCPTSFLDRSYATWDTSWNLCSTRRLHCNNSPRRIHHRLLLWDIIWEFLPLRNQRTCSCIPDEALDLLGNHPDSNFCAGMSKSFCQTPSTCRTSWLTQRIGPTFSRPRCFLCIGRSNFSSSLLVYSY